jgi:streptogramin lyase
VGVAVASCSSSHTNVDSGEPSLPAEPTTIVGPPEKTTTYGSLQQAVVKVDNADGIVAVGASLWTKTDDGRAVRIDPTTNKVTDQVSLDNVSDPSTYCQGIGTDGASVWACAAEDDGTGVAQIDAAKAHVVRRVQVGKIFDQLSLPATRRGIWILTGDGSTVRVVDPTTGHATSYPLGVACQQIAAEGDRVIATGSVANVVVMINAVTGAVLGRIHLPSPRIAAILDGDAWVDTDNGLTRIGSNLEVRAVYPDLSASSDGDVVAAADSIWVRDGDGTISRVDPSTGRIVERITPDHPLTAGSLYIAFGSIWTTSSDDGRVVRLRVDA